MKKSSQIEKHTAAKIREIIQTSPEPTTAEKDAKEIVDFYKKNYDIVQVVTCQKCGADLCIWVLDKEQYRQNLLSHHLGLRRIVLGDNLLASRKRLDGQMGYQCICGNDSRLSPVEKGIIGEEKWSGNVPALDPHLEAEVLKKIKSTNFQPDVQELDNLVVVEGFVHERVK